MSDKTEIQWTYPEFFFETETNIDSLIGVQAIVF